MSTENKSQLAEIKDDRDYAIRKGKVLERFQQEFHWRYKQTPLYSNVLELLIRDADPYEIIEKVIEINDEISKQLKDVMPFVSPNYYLHKKTQP